MNGASHLPVFFDAELRTFRLQSILLRVVLLGEGTISLEGGQGHSGPHRALLRRPPEKVLPGSSLSGAPAGSLGLGLLLALH